MWGKERERKWGKRLLKCQGCLAFDKEEFEWMPDMAVGDGVNIILLWHIIELKFVLKNLIYLIYMN